MMTVATLAALLAKDAQPAGFRCPGSLFAVRDDLPFHTKRTVRSERSLVDASGERVATIYYTVDGGVFIMAYSSMSRANQWHFGTYNGSSGYSPVRPLRADVPNDVKLETCPRH
ncbi:MAG: hypothetical protein KGN02_13805 [bacterium]|nr:hypothetical protein [bacterium]